MLFLLKLKPMKNKNKIRNMEDIRREKQKLRLEIGIHEYALNLNFEQIRNKASFLSLYAYLIDLVRAYFIAKIPSIFSGLLRRFWSIFMKKKR